MNTPTEKVKKIIKEMKLVLKKNSHVIAETVQVNFSEIANCSNDIKIFLYVNETNYIKYLNAKQDVLYDLLTLIEKENVNLAYPTQTVYVKNTEGDVE